MYRKIQKYMLISHVERHTWFLKPTVLHQHKTKHLKIISILCFKQLFKSQTEAVSETKMGSDI